MPAIDLSEILYIAFEDGDADDLDPETSSSGGGGITLDGIKFRAWELGDVPDPDPFA